MNCCWSVVAVISGINLNIQKVASVINCEHVAWMALLTQQVNMSPQQLGRSAPIKDHNMVDAPNSAPERFPHFSSTLRRCGDLVEVLNNSLLPVRRV